MGTKKNTVLDRIRANVNKETASIDVGEWSTPDDTFTVFYKPITLAGKQKVYKNARGDDHLTSLYTVIFNALDENGENLFTLADKSFLMKEAESKAVEKIALKILGVDIEELTPEK